MFTNGSMDFIENLIVGSYPNGLRDKDERQRYFDNFVRMFNRYDEQDVADVVEEVISRERFLPSLATFKEALDKKAQARAESERTALKIAEYRKPRGRVNVQALMEQAEKMKKGEFERPIPNRLREFAKRLWPDISDSVIRKNFPLLIHYQQNGFTIDEKGNAVQLYLSKTGEVVERTTGGRTVQTVASGNYRPVRIRRVHRLRRRLSMEGQGRHEGNYRRCQIQSKHRA